MKLKQFIDEWFPKTEEWDNIAKFILESGIELIDEENPKWLTGYTNIGRSYKPHHKDEYIRYMEESMFVLHDVVHQIFTLNIEEGVSEEEYAQRQIYGELFTFYLTEFVIPKFWNNKVDIKYKDERKCYALLSCILGNANYYHRKENVIELLYEAFIDKKLYETLKMTLKTRKLDKHFNKYSKMFKQDLKNSKYNYQFIPKGVENYCMVGASSQNHVDFFEAVKKGAVKNIKREFNLILPNEWI